MPIAFLTPDQVARYGCFPADLSLDQLARNAFLDATDRAELDSTDYLCAFIDVRCGIENR